MQHERGTLSITPRPYCTRRSLANVCTLGCTAFASAILLFRAPTPVELQARWHTPPVRVARRVTQAA